MLLSVIRTTAEHDDKFQVFVVTIDSVIKKKFSQSFTLMRRTCRRYAWGTDVHGPYLSIVLYCPHSAITYFLNFTIVNHYLSY